MTDENTTETPVPGETDSSATPTPEPFVPPVAAPAATEPTDDYVGKHRTPETTEDATPVAPEVVDTAPETTTVIQEEVASAPAEKTKDVEKVPDSRRPIFIIGLIILLILLLVGGVYAYNETRNAKAVVGSSGSPDGTAAKALDHSDGPVDPAVPKGVKSWTSWGQKSLQNRDMEASMLEAHGEKYHKYYAEMVAAEKKGKTFTRVYPAGTRFINCDYNVKDDGKYVFFWDTLKEDTTMLVFPDGTPAVKTTCGNTVIIPASQAAKPPAPVIKKTKKHKHTKKCANQHGQYVKHGRQNSATNVGATAGVTAGKPDKTYAQQQSEPKGGLAPTKKGTPGAGAGGSTPGGPGTGAPVANPGAGATIGGKVAQGN